MSTIGYNVRPAAPPPAGPREILPFAVAALIADAIAGGSHAPPGPESFFCTVGRHACDGIYFSESSGGQGVAGTAHYCLQCYRAKYGGGGETAKKKIVVPPTRVEEFRRAINPRRRDWRFVPTLEDALLHWAAANLPRAARAWGARDDRQWEQRVLASIFRERAAREPGWHHFVVRSRHVADVLRLAPFIGAVDLPSVPAPEVMPYAEWAREIGLLEGELEPEESR